MTSGVRQPPRIGRLLLRLARLRVRRPEIEADLLELFEIRTARDGHRVASWRYITDSLSLASWRPAGIAQAARQSHGGFRAMKQDMVFAARLLLRQPGLFGVTIAGLAVAIGISTAVFSIVHAVMFADYGISAPESVVRVALATGPFSKITGNAPSRGNWAFSDYRHLIDASTSLDLVASVRNGVELRVNPDQEEALPVSVMAVSGNYFPVLGLHTINAHCSADPPLAESLVPFTTTQA
jgi:hypothetical protein